MLYIYIFYVENIQRFLLVPGVLKCATSTKVLALDCAMYLKCGSRQSQQTILDCACASSRRASSCAVVSSEPRQPERHQRRMAHMSWAHPTSSGHLATLSQSTLRRLEPAMLCNVETTDILFHRQFASRSLHLGNKSRGREATARSVHSRQSLVDHCFWSCHLL